MFDVYSRSRVVSRDGVDLTVCDHGQPEGSPVLMIHGFPDSARLWRYQIPALIDAGHRVVAPDLRGFGRSDKPEDVRAYSMSELAADMIAVLDDGDIDRAHIVGHDWGAALAWYLAIRNADRLRSLVAVSAGHPSAFRAAGLRQLEKSWYTLLFQFPGIAEEWLSANDWERLRSWTGAISEVDNWIEDLSRPGALQAALAIYRANMGPKTLLSPPRDLPPVPVPVMGVWSTGDMALTEKQMTASEEHVAAEWSYQRLEGVSHWIPVEAPERLTQLLSDWLSRH